MNICDLEKKTTQVNHCNWMGKNPFRSVYNDNIFKNIHGQQQKSE